MSKKRRKVGAAKKVVSERDRTLARKVMDRRPDVVRADYFLAISDAGNIMIVHAASKSLGDPFILAVLDRANGDPIFELSAKKLRDRIDSVLRKAATPAQEKAICSAKDSKSKFYSDETVKTCKQFLNEEFERLSPDIVSSSTIELSEDGKEMRVVFEAVPGQMWQLLDIRLWKYRPTRPEEDVQSFRRSLEDVRVSLTETGKQAVTEMAKQACFRWQSEHKSAVKDFTPERKYLSGVPQSSIKAMQIVCNDSPLLTSPTLNSRYGDSKWKISFDEGIGIEVEADGSLVKLNSNTRSKLTRCVWAYEKRREIVDVISRIERTPFDFSVSQPKKHTIEIKVFSDHHDDKLTLDLDKPYKRETSRFLKHAVEAHSKNIEERREAACQNMLSGRLIALAIASVVVANEDFITANAVSKRLRGLSLKQDHLLEKTPYDGKFNLIPDAEIKCNIDLMVKDGIICESYREGHYDNVYYLLKTTDMTRTFIEMASSPDEQVKRIGRKRAAKRETVRLAEFSKPSLIADDVSALEYLLEHPAIWCMTPNSISQWLADMVGDDMRKYLKLRVKLEEDKSKKKYFRELLGVV